MVEQLLFGNNFTL